MSYSIELAAGFKMTDTFIEKFHFVKIHISLSYKSFYIGYSELLAENSCKV